ncbi:MAG: hypothetical protein KGS72_15995 [Cyanobacteria bacterium REEB67]|nr:hypothetical protein [Cyanobacteria bacterium REEB67]
MAADGARVAELHFPDNIIVATMQYPLGRETILAPPPQPRAWLKARGLVRLPRDRDIEVKLTYDGLQNLPYLKLLSVCRVTSFESSGLDFEDKHIQYLTPLQQLRRISLEDCLVTDKAFASLSRFPRLSNLSVGRSCIDGSGLGDLKGLSTLRIFCLEGNILKPGAVAQLKPLLPKLRSLNLTRTKLQKKDAAILKEMTDIEVVALADNKQIDDACMEYIKGLKHLHTLAIHDTAVTDRSIAIFQGLPSLKKVFVRDKTFWITRKRVDKIGNVEYHDAEQLSNIPVDILAPLH